MEQTKRGKAYSLPYSEYQLLVAEVTTAGCFSRTYLRHFLVTLVTLIGITLSAYVIVVTDKLWIQLLNACAAGFFTVQLGLIGHDLSHTGVFSSKKLNSIGALIVWGLGCGLSEGRWFFKHNAHHQSPNQIGHDPDVEIPFVFTHEQALLRSPFQQTYILPYQEILFWIGIWFVYPYNLLNSLKFLFRTFTGRSLFELILIAIHFTSIIWFTFLHLPPSIAVLFNLTVMLTTGIYMAVIFAPNHKGEDMLTPNENHNWVHQITLTRNIFSSPVTAYFFGGLDRQIEHHLFPTMSRFYYHRAQNIVRSFCIRYGIPYKETTWLESLQQIHNSLHEEARHWR